MGRWCVVCQMTAILLAIWQPGLHQFLLDEEIDHIEGLAGQIDQILAVDDERWGGTCTGLAGQVAGTADFAADREGVVGAVEIRGVHTLSGEQLFQGILIAQAINKKRAPLAPFFISCMLTGKAYDSSRKLFR